MIVRIRQNFGWFGLVLILVLSSDTKPGRDGETSLPAPLRSGKAELLQLLAEPLSCKGRQEMQLRSSTGKVIPLQAQVQLGRSLDPRLPAVISRDLATLTVFHQQCELKATKPVSVVRKGHTADARRATWHDANHTWRGSALQKPASRVYSGRASLKLDPNDRVHVFNGDFIVLRWDMAGMHGFELQTGSQEANVVRDLCPPAAASVSGRCALWCFAASAH